MLCALRARRVLATPCVAWRAAIAWRVPFAQVPGAKRSLVLVRRARRVLAARLRSCCLVARVRRCYLEKRLRRAELMPHVRRCLLVLVLVLAAFVRCESYYRARS